MPWEHAPGISRRMDSPVARGIVPQRDLHAVLRRRAVGRDRDGLHAGCGRRDGRRYLRLTLSSGRFAMIDNGLGFALVPLSESPAAA
jgi:hypothetical protein